MSVLHKKRNCGSVHAGVHIAVDVGEEGILPWHVMLVDPTEPVNLTALGVAPQGITVKERVVGWDMETGKPQYLIDPITGTPVCDMYDMIGMSHYPNAWDFVMECAVAGLHRFIPTNTQVQKLSPLSEYKGIHARGHIVDAFDFYKHRIAHDQFESCYSLDETVYKMHTKPTDDWLEYNSETCASLLYNNLMGSRGELDKETRKVFRQLELIAYSGYAPPEGIEIEWQPAIFIEFPLGRIAYWNVIDDGDEKTREKSKGVLDRLDESIRTYRIIEMEDARETDTV